MDAARAWPGQKAPAAAALQCRGRGDAKLSQEQREELGEAQRLFSFETPQ